MNIEMATEEILAAARAAGYPVPPRGAGIDNDCMGVSGYLYPAPHYLDRFRWPAVPPASKEALDVFFASRAKPPWYGKPV